MKIGSKKLVGLGIFLLGLIIFVCQATNLTGYVISERATEGNYLYAAGLALIVAGILLMLASETLEARAKRLKHAEFAIRDRLTGYRGPIKDINFLKEAARKLDIEVVEAGGREIRFYAGNELLSSISELEGRRGPYEHVLKGFQAHARQKRQRLEEHGEEGEEEYRHAS